jgi:hypothetical protein
MNNVLVEFVRRVRLPVVIAGAVSCLAFNVQAYTHPGIPTPLEELDTIKANLDQEPWKQGYARLAEDSHSQLTYTMQGPFANVSRAATYDQYLNAWRNDMVAVYTLSRMWYFTGNGAYAQKARDILIAWASIFDFGTGTDNYMFLTTQSGTGGSANKLRFAIRTPGVPENAANQLNSSVTTPSGSWAHVAVVSSGSTGRLYLNGAQVGLSTVMTLNPSSLGVTTKNYLGRSQFNDPYLDGSLDDFRIYSRALTAEEIAQFQTHVQIGLSLLRSFQPSIIHRTAHAVGYPLAPLRGYTTLKECSCCQPRLSSAVGNS